MAYIQRLQFQYSVIQNAKNSLKCQLRNFVHFKIIKSDMNTDNINIYSHILASCISSESEIG